MTRLDGSSCLWNFPAVTAFRVAFKLAEPQPLRKPGRPGPAASRGGTIISMARAANPPGPT